MTDISCLGIRSSADDRFLDLPLPTRKPLLQPVTFGLDDDDCETVLPTHRTADDGHYTLDVPLLVGTAQALAEHSLWRRYLAQDKLLAAVTRSSSWPLDTVR